MSTFGLCVGVGKQKVWKLNFIEIQIKKSIMIENGNVLFYGLTEEKKQKKRRLYFIMLIISRQLS